jgi:hypothetical protein
MITMVATTAPPDAADPTRGSGLVGSQKLAHLILPGERLVFTRVASGEVESGGEELHHVLLVLLLAQHLIHLLHEELCVAGKI